MGSSVGEMHSSLVANAPISKYVFIQYTIKLGEVLGKIFHLMYVMDFINLFILTDRFMCLKNGKYIQHSHRANQNE